MDLSNEKDFEKSLEQSEGSSSFKTVKFENGKNFVRILSTKCHTGYQHWVKQEAGALPTPIPSVNQEKGWAPEEDKIDAWAKDAFAKARKLDSEGDKGNAKLLKELAKKIGSTYSAKMVALPAKRVTKEDNEGDEYETGTFLNKKYKAEPQMLILSQTRMNSLLKEMRKWVEADSGIEAKFEKMSDLPKFVVCAEKDPQKRTITWSLHQQITDKLPMPEVDPAVVTEMLKEAEASYKALDREKFDEAYAKFLEFGTDASEDDDDDNGGSGKGKGSDGDLLDDDDTTTTTETPAKEEKPPKKKPEPEEED